MDKPAESMVCPEDITHALANLCRFTGHIRRFYPVALHCYFMSFVVPPTLALEALLHDAPEAYYGDISSPLKLALGLRSSPVIKAIDKVVRSRFGLAKKVPPEVHEADLRMLITERNLFFVDNVHFNEWNAARVRPYDKADLPELYSPDLDTSPDSAASKFLGRWKALRSIK